MFPSSYERSTRPWIRRFGNLNLDEDHVSRFDAEHEQWCGVQLPCVPYILNNVGSVVINSRHTSGGNNNTNNTNNADK